MSKTLSQKDWFTGEAIAKRTTALFKRDKTIPHCKLESKLESENKKTCVLTCSIHFKAPPFLVFQAHKLFQQE
jgi:hypothetical protein